MSGGSHDYLYERLRELADSIDGWSNGRYDEGPKRGQIWMEEPRRSLRIAFAAHLRECAEAAYAIEWVDSCDKARGEEEAPIRHALRGIIRQKPNALLVELL